MHERIKKLRKELRLTQQEFADKLGTSRNNIAGYEAMRREPSGAVIALICKTFNVNEQWLRTGEGQMFNTTTREQEIAAMVERFVSGDSDFKYRLISVLSRLKESEWARLEQLAQALLADPAPAPSSVAEAEAMYAQHLGFAPDTGSSASNTTAATPPTDGTKMA